MPGEFVNWTQEGNIAVVVVDNPPMNVLSSKVAEELLASFKEINAAENCRVMVLTGAGEKAFMAGADINELAEIIRTSASTLPYTKKLHDTFNYLENLPIPAIAAINGYALGGGLELALACDIRIASEKALLGVPEVKLGLFPGAGGTQRLPRLIGASLAKEMLFTGEPLTAAESLRSGLVNKVVPHGEVFSAARERAHLLASRPAMALKLVKEAVNRGIKLPLEEGCRVESDLLDRAFRTEDAREGVQSFLEKREAKFKHR
ncbi:MAG: enoyl-CoA hydratase [Dethiobacter sp.]|jgi:enoyl-CoA hydratase/carnithine racemase|nr:MAG: enoyl-CoA hydratase [Dethiobacter sp.]